jgi:hypothetical protein
VVECCVALSDGIAISLVVCDVFIVPN